jgi:hypothetical protein
MLIQAARRTPAFAAEPEPFVLQRSLGDFRGESMRSTATRRADGASRDVHESASQHPRRLQRVWRADHDPAYEGDPEQAKGRVPRATSGYMSRRPQPRFSPPERVVGKLARRQGPADGFSRATRVGMGESVDRLRPGFESTVAMK